MNHTDWCARDHNCAVVLGEHRARGVVINVPGSGRAVLTRVREADGGDVADIRLRVPLPAHEPYARAELALLLARLRTLVGHDRGRRT